MYISWIDACYARIFLTEVAPNFSGAPDLRNSILPYKTLNIRNAKSGPGWISYFRGGGLIHKFRYNDSQLSFFVL